MSNDSHGHRRSRTHDRKGCAEINISNAALAIGRAVLVTAGAAPSLNVVDLRAYNAKTAAHGAMLGIAGTAPTSNIDGPYFRGRR